MDSIWDIFKPQELIEYGGLLLILIIIFLENGVIFGFFLPGDSLLFTAGLLAYPGANRMLHVSLEHLIMGISAAAFVGYWFGYWFGHKTGNSLYKRPDSLFFKRKYVETAEVFYKKYGGMALILGRFLPIVRTFAPILAGVVQVRLSVFLMYNLIGALLWPIIICISGYYVGHLFPNALNYINYIVILFIVVTSIPIINTFRNRKKARNNAAE